MPMPMPMPMPMVLACAAQAQNNDVRLVGRIPAGWTGRQLSDLGSDWVHEVNGRETVRALCSLGVHRNLVRSMGAPELCVVGLPFEPCRGGNPLSSSAPIEWPNRSSTP